MKHPFASLQKVPDSSPQEAAVSPEHFTAEFMVVLQALFSDYSVTPVDSLHLKLAGPDGKESAVFLDNAYHEYVQDPAAKTGIIARFVASISEIAGEAVPPDPQCIVPVIKDRSWLEEVQRAIANNGSDKKAQQVVEDFNEDLIIVYAEDTPKSVRYLSSQHLEEAGIPREELRELAVANLRKILPPVEMHQGPLVSILSGGDYGASLLLINELWNEGKLEVDGDIVIAIPARDTLLFTGSWNTEGLKKLQEAASKTVAESSYALTDRLFVYRGGRFQRFVH